MSIIGILGICSMVLALITVCYVFSDSFLNQKTKNNTRYYGYGNQIKHKEIQGRKHKW